MSNLKEVPRAESPRSIDGSIPGLEESRSTFDLRRRLAYPDMVIMSSYREWQILSVAAVQDTARNGHTLTDGQLLQLTHDNTGIPEMNQALHNLRRAQANPPADKRGGNHEYFMDLAVAQTQEARLARATVKKPFELFSSLLCESISRARKADWKEALFLALSLESGVIQVGEGSVEVSRTRHTNTVVSAVLTQPLIEKKVPGISLATDDMPRIANLLIQSAKIQAAAAGLVSCTPGGEAHQKMLTALHVYSKEYEQVAEHLRETIKRSTGPDRDRFTMITETINERAAQLFGVTYQLL